MHGSNTTLTLANAATMHPQGDDGSNPFGDSPTAVYTRRIRHQYRIIGMLGVLLALALWIVILSPGKILYVPYMFEVNHTGEVRTVGMLPQAWSGPRPVDIEDVVKRLIYDLRRVGIDERMYGEQWREAKSYMVDKVSRQMESFVNEQQQRIKRGDTVQLVVTSFLQVPGSEGRQVEIEWTETVVNRQGTMVGVAPQQWKGLFQIGVVPPPPKKDTAELRNPRGIFVTDYSWGLKTVAK